MAKWIKTAQATCALAAVLTASFGAMAAPMSFSIERAGNRDIVGAVGEITSATPQDFARFAAANLVDAGREGIVLLHSPGGSVGASMRLGRMFREAGLSAAVARIAPVASGPRIEGGECYSACAYALMGAARRFVPPSSSLGIHRMSIPQGAGRVYAEPRYVEMLARYASSMGVDPEVVYAAETIAPDDLHIVSRTELAHWRLAGQKF